MDKNRLFLLSGRMKWQAWIVLQLSCSMPLNMTLLTFQYRVFFKKKKKKNLVFINIFTLLNIKGFAVIDRVFSLDLSAPTISFLDYRTGNLCFITNMSRFPPTTQPFPLSLHVALLCFSFLPQPVASGFWGKAEMAFEDGDSQVCPGPQPWMHAFVQLSHVFISCPCCTPHPLSAPHKLTRTCSCPHWGPQCTNDPANYVFKVFGSCENSFGL